MVKLDAKDRRILSALDMNARLPINELAKTVGVSRQVAAYRIRRLREEGVLVGAITIFDTATLGCYWFRVLMRLGQTSAEQRQAIIRFLAGHPASVWVGEIGGNWDLIVNLVARDNYEFNQLFEDFLARYGRHLQAYETLVYVDVVDRPRSYLWEDGGRMPELYHRMKLNPNIRLDDLDYRIIREMSHKANESLGQIARRIGATDKTVSARLKKMGRQGLIVGYRMLIRPAAVGRESYMVFLDIHNLQIEREKGLYGFLRQWPGVTFIVKHIGRWRIGIEVETKDRIEFQQFLVHLRENFGDIISDFETFPIFHDHQVEYFPRAAWQTDRSNKLRLSG